MARRTTKIKVDKRKKKTIKRRQKGGLIGPLFKPEQVNSFYAVFKKTLEEIKKKKNI
jgi:hypothetical protein